MFASGTNGEYLEHETRKVFSIFNLLKFSHLDGEDLDQATKRGRRWKLLESEIKQTAERSHYESGGRSFDILIATRSHNLTFFRRTSHARVSPRQESSSAMFVIHYSQNQIKSNIIKVVSGAAKRLEIEKTRNLLEQFEYKISLLV